MYVSDYSYVEKSDNWIDTMYNLSTIYGGWWTLTPFCTIENNVYSKLRAKA